MKISILIPAKNEARNLPVLLDRLESLFPDAEIIVVDDGSTDQTAEICKTRRLQLIRHPYSMGNGAAVKTAARAATGDVLVFMDADGQHQPEDIPYLLEKIKAGYDMVVGSRQSKAQASFARLCANSFYNRLASWMTGQTICDLTSGFRAVNTAKFTQFLYLLPNGFSYPTTITMAFFRAGYSVAYIPATVLQRQGNSHIKPIRDGLRFLLIIFKIGTLYSPLKIFTPVSFAFLILGAIRYLWTYIEIHRFTNMSALLFITSAMLFMLGLISEQISNLMYTQTDQNH